MIFSCRKRLNQYFLFSILSLTAVGIFSGCQSESIQLEIPDGFPQPTFPEDNTPTVKRVLLGEKLFFDKNLSLDSSVACVNCHLPQLAFTDGRSKSTGIYGRQSKRNAPSILNAAYLTEVNRDGGVKKLDLQAIVPIEDEHEMGISLPELAKRLEQDPAYTKLAQEAYQQTPNPFVITRALATFIRTLYSGDSPYDQFIHGDTTALNASAQYGKTLFESDRLNCTSCHSGYNFTNGTFQNNGLYEEYVDLGRMLITADSADLGKFRVPSLRNVALTAPYMHDGSLATLDAVLDHYQHRGANPTRLQSANLRAFTLTEDEKEALLAFLKSLTGQTFPYVTE
ncbi:MAG: c-type cytochrome [Saprospiraceae bacterium]|nr:c-type cytochrome [Saprospiraceae bacterium]